MARPARRNAGTQRVSAGPRAKRGRGAARARRLRAWVFPLGLLLTMLVPGNALGGGAPVDPRARAANSARLRARSKAKKAKAIEYAKARGLPVRERAGRRIFELMEVRNGRPLYYTTHNENAAISTAADQVRSAYVVDGAGLTVGVWDGGWASDTHDELVGRVAQKDIGADSSAGSDEEDHATHVAGTIGASGAVSAAKGMAPAVSIDSYEWNDDGSEMTQRGASYPGEPGKIYVSNHSYSYVAGWSPYLAVDGQDWWIEWDWYGPWPVQATDPHDDLFGQYENESAIYDGVAFGCPYYLIFLSAGNDRNDSGPAEGEGFWYIQDGYWEWFDPYHPILNPTGGYDPAVHPLGDGAYFKGSDDEYYPGYGTVSPCGVAKNAMTVGAVTDAVSSGSRSLAGCDMTAFSSWGPTNDGRIKPDIVANGYQLYSSVAHVPSTNWPVEPVGPDSDDSYDSWNGTSMSSPNAAGSAILLQHHYAAKFPGHAMRASTLKGLILHTADDLGRPGPDYCYGWGLMNAKAAADVITDSHDTPSSRRIIEGRLSPTHTSDGFALTLSAAGPIRATICWMDPPGEPRSGDDASSNLVNDLDLVVTGSGTYYPYVLDPGLPDLDATTPASGNHRDNVEQVYISDAPAGSYTITVDFTGSLTGAEQWYSLVVTGGGVACAGGDALDVTGVSPTTEGRRVAEVEVVGTGFLPGAEVSIELDTDTISASGEQVAPGSIRAILDLTTAAYGTWDVTVTNPGGSSDTLPAGLTVAAMSIADVTNETHPDAASRETVGKYSKVELLVDLDCAATDLYYEADRDSGGLDLSGDFSFWGDPKGSSIVYTRHVHGFYDGSDWRIRFAPDAEGEWTFSVSAYDPSCVLDTPQTWSDAVEGRFNCVSSGSLGWLRVAGPYLKYTEKSATDTDIYFFGVGHNIGWRPDAEEPSLESMAARGENILSFWIAEPWNRPSWTTDTDPFRAKRAPIENIEGGIGDYNTAACAHLDELVSNAEQHNVFLLPTIWSHAQLRSWDDPWSQGWWDQNAYSTVCDSTEFFELQDASVDTPQWHYQKNFYRYLVARWGYSPAVAAWVAVCEIDGTTADANGADVTPWCTAVRDFFRANDPFRSNGTDPYPITVTRTDWDSDAIGWSSGFDMRALDSYTYSDSDTDIASTIADQITSMWGTKPCFHAEFGGDVPGGASQPTHLHNGIWAGAASGACMTPLVWTDGYNFPMLQTGDPDLAVNAAMRDHLQYIAEFMGTVDYLGPGLSQASLLVEYLQGQWRTDSFYEAWGMKTADRGFVWIHRRNGDVGNERRLTVSDVSTTDGPYAVVWYDVWQSGSTEFRIDQGADVDLAPDGSLTVTIPDLSQRDIACKFMPVDDLPTPVVMSSVRARSVGAGALVEWTTASELENAGFDVLRRSAPGGDFERATPRPVEGRITAAGEKTYAWLDLVGPGTWEYRVETVSTTGVRERHGSGADMTVTVRPADAPGSMGEIARGAAGRLAAGLRDTRSRADTRARRGELARRPRRPLPRNAAPPIAAQARILASVADRTGALPADGAFRPSAGDAKIVTRGDGVFLVPASALGGRPRRARFVTGGMASPPLAVGRGGAWFFASGYRDPYTDLNATFVTECSGPPVVRPSPGRPPRGPVITTARAVARADTEGRYVIGLAGLPDPWVHSQLVSDSVGEVEVPVCVRDLLPGPATLRVAACGYTEDARVSPDHELVVSLNGHAFASFAWDGLDYRLFDIPLPRGVLREGTNAVGLLAPRSVGIPGGHGVVVDRVEIEYDRRLSLAGGPFALELASDVGARAIEVNIGPRAGARKSAPWVVEVDASGRSGRVAAPVHASGAGAVARFTAREGFAYYVAPAGGWRSPERLTRARVASLEPGTAYVAVGPEEFRGGVAPLIRLRSAEGMPSAYVSLDEAADTWGWGRYGAPAITSLVRATAPRYLLLVGDNAYDYRSRAAGEADPMVPAFLARSSRLAESNADALYGDVDSDGVPDFPVGRLPVRTAVDLSNLVGKIVSRCIAGSEPAGVLLAGRSGKGEDFAGASRRLTERFPTVAWTELYAGITGDEAAVAEALARTVDAGTDLVVYQGHGSLSVLGKGLPLLDVRAASAWRSSPVVCLSTCWGAFIQRETEAAETIAETLLRSEAGSPAVVGASVSSTQAAQEILLNAFLDGTLSEGEPLGDALVAAQRRAAERAASASRNAAEALMDVARFYVLLGDPAMSLAGPAPCD